MKKLILTTLIITASIFAQGEEATSTLKCLTKGESFGQESDVTVTINLMDHIGVTPVGMNIQAQGNSILFLDGSAKLKKLTNNKVIISFAQKVASPVVPATQIELELQVKPELLGGLSLVGLGGAKITNAPTVPTLKPEYKLTDCEGVLN